MKRYQCKHVVEAMQWIDTDENREAFAAWFDEHDVMFETRGSIIVLPHEGGEWLEGAWVVLSDHEFIAMDDDVFRDTYSESP